MYKQSTNVPTSPEEPLLKDPMMKKGDLLTYEQAIDRKCCEAVRWTARMMPAKFGDYAPQFEKLEEDVLDKVLHRDR